jgi:hypothetical protein
MHTDSVFDELGLTIETPRRKKIRRCKECKGLISL